MFQKQSNESEFDQISAFSAKNVKREMLKKLFMIEDQQYVKLLQSDTLRLRH